jgi:hypothetical protein
MIASMVMEKTTIRRFIFPVVLMPYIISMMGMFTSYFTFFYRTNFLSTVTALKDDKLERLVLSSTEFENTKWTDGKKEFERNGKMFDIARIERQGDFYFVYCENDSLEDLLISYLKTNGSKTKITLIFHLHFFERIQKFDCSNAPLGLVKRDPRTINLYRSVPDELNTPPPKVS